MEDNIKFINVCIDWIGAEIWLEISFPLMLGIVSVLFQRILQALDIIERSRVEEVTTNYQLNCRTLLTYVDGKIYACEIDSNYGFYYKEFGNSICYGEIDTSTETLPITMYLAELVDFNLVEKFSGEYYEEDGIELYSIEGVDCTYDEYYRKFGFDDMKDSLYTMYNSIEEAFHALNLQ